MYTSPVNHSAGPFSVGCFGSMSISDVPLCRAGRVGPVVSGRPSSRSTDTTRSSPGPGGRVVPGHDRTPLPQGASRNVGSVTSNRADVRDFLVTRRAKITPQQAGLTIYGGNRRVPG